MKASQDLVEALKFTVLVANQQRDIGGSIAVNTSLSLACNRWSLHDSKLLETILDALNQLEVSIMREEFINLIEGMLALREIKPMMDVPGMVDDMLETKKNYGKCLIFRRCNHQNPDNSFDCTNCGERFDPS